MNSIRNVVGGIFQGIVDSLRGITVVCYLDKEIQRKQAEQNTNPKRDSIQSTQNQSSKPQQTDNKEEKGDKTPTIAKRVLQCCLLNGGIFWFSIAFFEYLVLPGLSFLTTLILGSTNLELCTSLWIWLKPSLKILFALIWIVPLFVMSKIINSLWFQDIADSAYKVRKGRPQYIPAISKLVADVLMNLLVEGLFLGQSMLVHFIPIGYLGRVLSFIHICLLYSLYSFEYKWFNMGWELPARLTFIESNWPYFIGFGLPLAVLTEISSSFLVSGCVFSILFPLLILSSNEANPKINTCDLQLKLFSPVILISNAFFSRGVQRPLGPVTSNQPSQPPMPIRTNSTPSPVSNHQKYTKNVFPSAESASRSTPSPTTRSRTQQAPANNMTNRR